MKVICEHALECRDRTVRCAYQTPREVEPTHDKTIKECYPDIYRYPEGHKDYLPPFLFTGSRRIAVRLLTPDDLQYHVIVAELGDEESP